jgi:hypothetical protein
MKPFLLALTSVGLAFSAVKMEDKYALANVDEITAVPGIAWGEWGPGDQAMSLMGLEYLKKGGSDEAHAGTGGLTPEGLEQLIKPGIMVTHGTSVELTNKGRALTKRQMPY